MENDKELMTQEEKDIQGAKENNKGGHKVFAVIGAIVVAIVGIIGLIFGKVVEATLFEEVAKGVVMALVVAVIVCAICYVPVTMASDARRRYYPLYGKKGFKHALKAAFGKE